MAINAAFIKAKKKLMCATVGKTAKRGKLRRIKNEN
jgi:hypothetical protein